MKYADAPSSFLRNFPSDALHSNEETYQPREPLPCSDEIHHTTIFHLVGLSSRRVFSMIRSLVFTTALACLFCCRLMISCGRLRVFLALAWYSPVFHFQGSVILSILLVSELACRSDGASSKDVIGLVQTIERQCDGRQPCFDEIMDNLVYSLSNGSTELTLAGISYLVWLILALYW